MIEGIKQAGMERKKIFSEVSEEINIYKIFKAITSSSFILILHLLLMLLDAVVYSSEDDDHVDHFQHDDSPYND
jgi:hypothetical protein